MVNVIHFMHLPAENRKCPEKKAIGQYTGFFVCYCYMSQNSIVKVLFLSIFPLDVPILLRSLFVNVILL